MTFGEAMTACMKGKRIRETRWHADLFWVFDNGWLMACGWYRPIRAEINMGNVASEDWEIVPYPARAQARRDKDKAALQEFRDAAQRSTAKFNARMAIADAAIAWRRGGFSATLSQDLLRAVRKWEELPE